MPFGFFFDPTYVLLIPALIFALWAQWKVQKTYAKYSKVRAANGRTGREIASAIMARNGVTDVSIEEVVITLPVEFNASKRALVQLTSTGALAPGEVEGAKKVLDAAALTYVAAAAMAALQLIRLVLLRDSRR